MHSDFQTGQIYTKGSGHLKCQFGCGVLILGSQKYLNSQKFTLIFFEHEQVLKNC